MPTIYHNHIKPALEAVLEANKITINKLTLQVEILSKQMNQIKSKWENLNERHQNLQKKFNLK